MELALTVTLLRLPEVEKATGLKKSAIYSRIKEGTFPAPICLGAKARAWKSDAIAHWIDERPLARKED